MKRYLASLVMLAMSGAPLAAQNGLAEQCAASSTICSRLAEGAEITQVRTGIAFSGGNPVMGAASTLGLRLGTLPRLSVSARMTGAQLEFDEIQTGGGGASSFPRSLNVDVAIGVFSGLSLLPTVGGFGSIDLLASYGKLTLSDDEGFTEREPTSWAAGARIGILRESFTAPGIAVSGMYRKVGDVQLGSEIGPADGPGTYFAVADTRVLSGRATIGKRILFLGAVAGIGYDKYTSDALIQNETAFTLREESFSNSRTTAFANVSWTMLILHIVGEGGVQRGGEENAYYGSLAVRLAL